MEHSGSCLNTDNIVYDSISSFMELSEINELGLLTTSRFTTFISASPLERESLFGLHYA